MDFTNTHYCKVSKCLLMGIGLWPEQTSTETALWTCFVLLLLLSGAITSMLPMLTKSMEIDNFTATYAPCTTACIALTKFCTYLIHNKKISDLQDRMNANWRNLRIKKEIEIMERYVGQAKLFATVYTLYMLLGGLPFFLMMFRPKLLDLIKPLNESRPMGFMYPAEYYFISEEDYYSVIITHMMMCCILVLLILSACDSMLMVYVHYACGMLAVIGYRLEFALYKIGKADSVESQKDVYRRYISHCVQDHHQVLKYTESIEAIFSNSYLVQLCLSVSGASVCLYQVLVLIGEFELIRYVLFVIGHFLHILCPSYQGQKLLNHSLDTPNRIYNGVWYNIPTETQKLLLFILTNATPCSLTAGKMYVFSMENYSSIVQTCMSYFMMLASFR